MNFNQDTLRRFALHIAVAAAGAALLAVPQFLQVFELPPYVNAFLVALAASVGSFVRKQEQAIDSGE